MLPTLKQQNALNTTLYFTCSASTIMTLMIIACYIFIKRLRQIEFLMIVMTCVGDLIASLTLLIAIPYDKLYPMEIVDQTSTNCIIQGLFVQFGGIFSFIWTANIAYASKMSIMPLTPESRQRKIRIMFYVGFSVPIILTLLPLIASDYKLTMLPLSPIICQISGGRDNILGNAMLFICFYIPLILVIIFNTICMYEVVNACKLLTNDQVIIRQVQHLLLYPVILVLCWVSFLILRIMDSFSTPPVYSFQIICYGTSKLNGFFDGLAYGYNAITSWYQSDKERRKSSSDNLDISSVSESD